jgi:glycosyltransferase involved in cell wall biosynthesis
MFSLKVTVCVPTYNKATLLDKSLRSILAQTFSHFKLIVVDDHSTDSTQEVVRSLNDSRVHYVLNSHNLGLTSNWNRCLELAMNEDVPYIAIYHDDDIYSPDILKREVEFLDQHSQVGLVHTALYYLSEEDGHYTLRRPYPTDRVMTALEILYDLCEYGRYHITTPSVLARRDAYVRAGTFDPDFKICPDLDLWWRILERFNLGYIADPLITVRIHPAQMSSSEPAARNAITQYETRMVLEKAVARLESSGVERDWRKVRARLNRFCAERMLKAGRDNLLIGNQGRVWEACREALRLSPNLKTRLLALLLVVMNNAVGRIVMRTTRAGWRLVRSSRWLF